MDDTEAVTPLDEILDGDSTETTEQQETPATEEKEPAAEESKETKAPVEEPDETKGEDKTEAPPAPKDGTVPIAALLDERDKRQALETRLAALEKQEAKPAPDILEDPDGFREHLRQETHAAILNSRLDISESILRQSNDDVDAKMAIYQKIVEQDPSVHQRVIQAKHPWQTMYDIAKGHEAIERAGGVDQLLAEERTKVEAEVRAKVEQEFKDAAAKTDKARSDLPTSLAGEPNKGTRSGPELSEDTLEDLVSNIEDQK